MFALITGAVASATALGGGSRREWALMWVIETRRRYLKIPEDTWRVREGRLWKTFQHQTNADAKILCNTESSATESSPQSADRLRVHTFDQFLLIFISLSIFCLFYLNTCRHVPTGPASLSHQCAHPCKTNKLQRKLYARCHLQTCLVAPALCDDWVMNWKSEQINNPLKRCFRGVVAACQHAPHPSWCWLATWQAEKQISAST